MDDTDSKSDQAGLKAEHFGADLEAFRPLVEAVACVSADPQPPGALQARLSERIAADAGGVYVSPPPRQWQEPDWNEVGAGIFCKLLTADTEMHVVGMLVRLAPGAHYPPHLHAGVEELHLLDGELWIGTRKLHPGDYNRAEPGTGDRDVWSETGCICVLITSADDVLG